MGHTIIGTAGHIDHGKTLLVKALTGTDTDRAPEEKARGITIELGFAFLGEEATIIDVPGHERFVKTMVAGVSTIDVALLVIAADDGVMPQSREHLDVLELLGVERGIVVLNKADLVDEDWLDLVEEEVRELVVGTFLEGADIARVSALAGDGVEALKSQIEELVVQTEERRGVGPFRLPVDRAFVVKGFGLVGTGTVITGRLEGREDVEVLPAGERLRVRGLQRHGQEVEAVQAGDRAAVNLPGVSTEQVERGDWLAAPDYFKPTYMVDARLSLLSSCPRELVQRTRVRLHIGTREAMARVVLLEGEALEPGGEMLVQLHMETPVVAVWGDRFVIRRYSPALTIGGGRVLEPHPRKHRRGDREAVAYLEELDGTDAEAAVEVKLRHLGETLKADRELAGELGLDLERVTFLLEQLAEDGKVALIRVDQALCAIHAETEAVLGKRVEAALEQFHAENPLKTGLRREELRALSLRHAAPALFDHLLQTLERQGRLGVDGAMMHLAGHRIQFSAAEEEQRDKIEVALKQGELSDMPGVDELARLAGVGQRQVESILRALQTLGAVVPLEGGLWLHAETLAAVQDKLRGYLAAEGQITVAAFRDLIQGNRKYALALLTYFDSSGVTQRQGDVRVLLT